MEVSRIQTGEKDRITIHALSSSGAGVTGQTVELTIRRDSDGFFYNGATFQAAATTVTMSELDSTNLAGVYYYDFTAPVLEATYTLLATTSGSSVANDPWMGQVKAGYWADNFDASLSSRASTTEAANILKHIGTSIVELDLQRLVGFCGQILSAIKQKGIR